MSNVKIVEVGPRDGLQNEATPLSQSLKCTLIERLYQSGLRTIEAGAFVSPKWVPQMADSEDVLTTINQAALSDAHFPVLVPNMRGLTRAVQAGAQEIALFTAASQSFSLKNTNVSIEDGLARLAEVAQEAKRLNIRVRGYLSTIAFCPYEGEISPEAVSSVAKSLFDMGCYEVSLGDTVGRATIFHVNRLLDVLSHDFDLSKFAGHYHDTYGQALANIAASYKKGINVFDASVAGLGGCPYAPGAGGNVATEDVVYFFQSLGQCEDVDLMQLAQTGAWISEKLNRPLLSKAALALNAHKSE